MYGGYVWLSTRGEGVVRTLLYFILSKRRDKIICVCRSNKFNWNILIIMKNSLFYLKTSFKREHQIFLIGFMTKILERAPRMLAKKLQRIS